MQLEDVQDHIKTIQRCAWQKRRRFWVTDGMKMFWCSGTPQNNFSGISRNWFDGGTVLNADFALHSNNWCPLHGKIIFICDSGRVVLRKQFLWSCFLEYWNRLSKECYKKFGTEYWRIVTGLHVRIKLISSNLCYIQIHKIFRNSEIQPLIKCGHQNKWVFLPLFIFWLTT